MNCGATVRQAYLVCGTRSAKSLWSQSCIQILPLATPRSFAVCAVRLLMSVSSYVHVNTYLIVATLIC